MGFGQQSGPPATHRQLKELGELLGNLGYSDFRDARGPMGFNQRQAGGKFTNEEAQALIDELQQAEWDAEEQAAGIKPEPKPASEPTTPKRTAKTKATHRPKSLSGTKAGRRAAPRLKTKTGIDLSKCTDQQLAAELQDRGWVVMEP